MKIRRCLGFRGSAAQGIPKVGRRKVYTDFWADSFHRKDPWLPSSRREAEDGCGSSDRRTGHSRKEKRPNEANLSMLQVLVSSSNKVGILRGVKASRTASLHLWV